jgi:hypothetical protein
VHERFGLDDVYFEEEAETEYLRRPWYWTERLGS